MDLFDDVSGNFQSRCVRGRKIRIYNISGSDGVERKSAVARRTLAGSSTCSWGTEYIWKGSGYESKTITCSLSLSPTHPHTHLYIVWSMRMAAHKELWWGAGVEWSSVENRTDINDCFIRVYHIYIYILYCVCVILYYILGKSRNENKLLPPINLMTFVRKKVILFLKIIIIIYTRTLRFQISM